MPNYFAQIHNLLLMQHHRIRIALPGRHVAYHDALIALNAVRYPGGF